MLPQHQIGKATQNVFIKYKGIEKTANKISVKPKGTTGQTSSERERERE